MRIFTAVVIVGALVAAARAIPNVPQNEHEIDNFVDQHGTTLFEQFARARISSDHKRAAHTIADETVQKTAQMVWKRVQLMDRAKKVNYLTGMQKKVAILEAGI